MPKLTFEQEYHYDPYAEGIEIPVSLVVQKQLVQAVAKIDTGATHCVFPRRFAKLLDLDVESGEVCWFQTANSRFQAFGHAVQMHCLGMDFNLNIYFPEDPTIQKAVLGRNGWLEQVRLGLVDYDRRLLISHYDAT